MQCLQIENSRVSHLLHFVNFVIPDFNRKKL